MSLTDDGDPGGGAETALTGPQADDDGIDGGDATSGAASADITAVADDALAATLEAILLVVDEPASAETLAAATGRPSEQIETVLGELAQEYTDQGRGLDLRQVGDGWRLFTRAEYAPYVERYLREGQNARLTQAALETLAVVAYRQPVSRSRIAAIRGVNVDGVVRTLVNRGLIQEVATDPSSSAVLYGTTPYFLDRLGLDSLDDLPPLAAHLPDPDALDAEEDWVSTGS